jgi:Ca-activated chloride channel family protein
MPKRLLLALILTGVLAAALISVYSASAQEDQTRIRVRVDRVPVVFSAFDRKLRFVTDLSREEVQVLDNNKKQDVVDFVRETDLPLRIGLLIDTSNSIRERFKFEQEAAIEFLQSVVRRKTDRAFVLSFYSVSEVVQDFTDDMGALSSAIRSQRPGGGTALYDALYYAVRDKLMAEDPQGGVRRCIILISDGDDNMSRASREDALAMAQRGEVTIFTIGTNQTKEPTRGDKVLRRFAEESGGRAFFPFQVSDVSTSFEQIGKELRSQYALIYKPNTPRDGTFHSIQVVSLRKNVAVRARKGYFAAKE